MRLECSRGKQAEVEHKDITRDIRVGNAYADDMGYVEYYRH
jgi:hypothetical protein